MKARAAEGAGEANMLFIVFQLGTDRYAIAADQMVEVLPLVALKRLPQAARGVAGAFDYRGQPVPVMDLNELAFGEPAPARVSTRVLLVNYPLASGETRVLGLIAGRATEAMRREPKDFADAGVNVKGAPYLGPVTRDDRGLIQWVEVKKLLPPEVQALLFQPAVATT